MQLPRFEYTVKPPHTAGLIDIGSIVQGAQGMARGIERAADALMDWSNARNKAEAEVQIAEHKLEIDKYLAAKADAATRVDASNDEKAWSTAFATDLKYDMTKVSPLAKPVLQGHLAAQSQEWQIKLGDGGRKRYESGLMVRTTNAMTELARKRDFQGAYALAEKLAPHFSPERIQKALVDVTATTFDEAVTTASSREAAGLVLVTAQQQAKAHGIPFDFAAAQKTVNERANFLRTAEDRNSNQAESIAKDALRAAFAGGKLTPDMINQATALSPGDREEWQVRLRDRISDTSTDHHYAAIDNAKPESLDRLQGDVLADATLSDRAKHSLSRYISSRKKESASEGRRVEREEKTEKRDATEARWNEILDLIPNQNAHLLKTAKDARSRKHAPDAWLAESRVKDFDRWSPKGAAPGFNKAFDLNKDKLHTVDELQQALKNTKSGWYAKTVGAFIADGDVAKIEALIKLYGKHEDETEKRKALFEQYKTEWEQIKPKGKK